jgi:hypothetical protein
MCAGSQTHQVHVVPIHAYPVAHGFSFPKKIDFGSCPLGRVRTKRIEMKCQVPVSFEYEIEPSEAADFKIVTPLKGKIPANGSTYVEIQFSPLKFATVSFTFRVKISQYDFKPILCEVTGSALPGIVRKIATDRVRSSSPTHFEHCMDTPETLITRDGRGGAPTPPPPEKKPKEITNNDTLVRRGAGPLDGGATVMFEKHRRQHLRFLQNNNSKEQKQCEDEEKRGGLRVPALHVWEKSPMRAMEFVLTQSPGKLKPKDLKKAIEARRAQREAQIEASKTIRDDSKTATDSKTSSSSSSSTTTTRQIKEIAFKADMDEIEREERRREFMTDGEVLGERLLGENEMKQIRDAERDRREQERKSKEEMSRSRKCTLLEGPNNVRDPVRVRITTVDEVEVRDNARLHFDKYENDMWEIRRRVVERFRGVCGTIVARNRADDRIKKIQSLIGDVLNGKNEENEGKKDEDTIVDVNQKIEWRAGIVSATLPSSSSSSSSTRTTTEDKKIDQEDLTTTTTTSLTKLPVFDDLSRFDLRHPLHYTTMKYKEKEEKNPMTLLPITCDVRREIKNRVIVRGAFEETGVNISEASESVGARIEAVIGKIELPFLDDTDLEENILSEFQVDTSKSNNTITPPHYRVPALMSRPTYVETDVTYSLRARSRGREIEMDERTDEDGNGNYCDLSVLEQLEFCEEMVEYAGVSNEASPVVDESQFKKKKLLRGALSEDELSDSDTDTEDEHELPLGQNEQVLNRRYCVNLFQDIQIGSSSSSLFRVKYRSLGSVPDYKQNDDEEEEEEEQNVLKTSLKNQESSHITRARLVRKRRDKETNRLMESVEMFTRNFTKERDYKLREQLRSCFDITK